MPGFLFIETQERELSITEGFFIFNLKKFQILSILGT